MKKKLIALAALAASSVALAQSSVTLYGTADVGVGKLQRQKTGMQANTLYVNTSDSYLGFRGVEDLGGGLKAGFNFEQGINLKDGSSDERASKGLTRTMFQRSANLWLGGAWGTFQMGRANTPSRNAMAAWDLMGRANNSVAAATFGAVGGDTDDRHSSQFIYKTPDFGGFRAEVAYVFKADYFDLSKVDLGLIYANGPLTAGLAYNKTKKWKANYALGAQYSFGSFALATGYYHSRNGSYNDDNTGLEIPGAIGRASGFTLGGKAHFGAMSVALDLARTTKQEYDLGGVTHKGKKYTNAVLEGRYAFSKRTFAYATYMRREGGNNYALGMRHDF